MSSSATPPASAAAQPPEVCNGIDDDGDTAIDEGVGLTFHFDADGDGFGGLLSSTPACSPGPGFSGEDGDNWDDDPARYPAALEVCNGIDDNQNGTADEGALPTFWRDADGDGFGNPAQAQQSSAGECSTVPPSGWVDNDNDTDDANPTIHPSALSLSIADARGYEATAGPRR
jgi:hypothetical protein